MRNPTMTPSDVEAYKEMKEYIRKISYRLEMLKFYSSAATLYRWEKACNFMHAPATEIEKKLAEDISPDQLSLFEQTIEQPSKQ